MNRMTKPDDYKNELQCRFSRKDPLQFQKLVAAIYGGEGEHKYLNFYTRNLSHSTGEEYPEAKTIEELTDCILDDMRYHQDDFIMFSGFTEIPEKESTILVIHFEN